MFTDYSELQKLGEVTVGDGRVLKIIGQGTVRLLMKLPGGKVQRCMLNDVLHIPDLSYNLESVSKASEKGKVTEFDGVDCRIRNAEGRVVAMATRCGSLYFLDCQSCEHANVVGLNEVLWHKPMVLGYDGLRRLAV